MWKTFLCFSLKFKNMFLICFLLSYDFFVVKNMQNI